MYEIGQTYCISLAGILSEIEGKSASDIHDGERFYLEYGYVDCSRDRENGEIYIDFYDNERNLAIMDGEEAELVDIDDYAATFICHENEIPVRFKLGLDEVEAAVY